jgi:glycosyltransferase involved in cell wall biosynthesis
VIQNIKTECTSIDYELVIVDDGSTDETTELLKEAGIKTHRNQFQLGYGATIKVGVREASNEIICITDADGTYPSERIPDLLYALIECEADMVVGARPWNKIELKRRLAKYIIHKFSELLLSHSVPDMNSGLRVFKKSIFNQFINIFPNGFSITSTMTMAFSFYGFRTEFIPIDYHERVGKSKIHPIRDTLNFIQLILRTTVYFDPLKIFLPPALVFILIGVILAIFQVIFIQNITSVTAIILFSGMQLLATGLLADMINRKL